MSHLLVRLIGWPASIIHGDPNLKIYTASVSPAGLRTSGEVADGVLPFFMSPEKAAAIVDPIVEGRVRAGKPRDLADFDNAPYVRVSMGEDVAKYSLKRYFEPVHGDSGRDEDDDSD